MSDEALEDQEQIELDFINLRSSLQCFLEPHDENEQSAYKHIIRRYSYQYDKPCLKEIKRFFNKKFSYSSENVHKLPDTEKNSYEAKVSNWVSVLVENIADFLANFKSDVAFLVNKFDTQYVNQNTIKCKYSLITWGVWLEMENKFTSTEKNGRKYLHKKVLDAEFRMLRKEYVHERMVEGILIDKISNYDNFYFFIFSYQFDGRFSTYLKRTGYLVDSHEKRLTAFMDKKLANDAGDEVSNLSSFKNLEIAKIQKEQGMVQYTAGGNEKIDPYFWGHLTPAELTSTLSGIEHKENLMILENCMDKLSPSSRHIIALTADEVDFMDIVKIEMVNNGADVDDEKTLIKYKGKLGNRKRRALKFLWKCYTNNQPLKEGGI